MSSLTFIRYLIECDGCRRIFGNSEGFESLTEARALAYPAGWRFPNQITTNGKTSTATSDVCPECDPSWKPQKISEKAGSARLLSKAEVAELADR